MNTLVSKCIYILLCVQENELLQLKLLRSTVSLLKNVVLHFKIQDSSTAGNGTCVVCGDVLWILLYASGRSSERLR